MLRSRERREWGDLERKIGVERWHRVMPSKEKVVTKRKEIRMRVEIYEINYIPGDSYIQTGFRRGQYPRANTYYGGNGTYRVCYPGDVEVVVHADGHQLTFRIGSDIRRIVGCRNLTRNLVSRIRNASPGWVELENQNGHWGISEESLKVWLGNL